MLFVALLASLLLVGVPPSLSAQQDASFKLTPEALHAGEQSLDEAGWRLRAGDDAAWARTDFDDSAWEKLRDTDNNIADLLRGEWNGRAWFRLRVEVDARLVNQPLALRVWHGGGASEVYVDGVLVQSFGRIEPADDEEWNPRGMPATFVFAEGGTHTIAVRYSFRAASDLTQRRGRWLARGRYTPRFSSRLTTAQDASHRLYTRAREEREDYFFVGLLFALALVHFLLFVFDRRERGNLFYSFFVMGLALTLWLARLASTGHTGATTALAIDIVRNETQGLAVMSLLAFLYVEFAGRVSRFFWILLALWFVCIVLHAGQFISLGSFFTPLMLIVTLADALRIMSRALVKRRAGAWIIAAGIGLLVVCVGVNIAVGNSFIMLPAWFRQANLNLTVLSMPVAVAIYLARRFARTNRDLEAQLANVQELSARQLEHERTEAELRLRHEQERAENERRAKELEEARQLQLSMLPRTLPQLPHLEIAAYMKPATEVGGDYYDFHVSTDGTLTVVVGDATGHGLKAGTMVTAMKSLFGTLAPQDDMLHIFEEANRVLKGMKMRGLFMALLMLKVRGDSLSVCSAGIPPMLVYRAALGVVEEIVLQAVPLGGVASFAYQQRQTHLTAGDCIMLMSDGFPERFNGTGEMLGYDKAAAILKDNAHLSPQEIIDNFVRAGDEWAGGTPQDDDVTFVVLKAGVGFELRQAS
jgi:serine phosphatase RsbU (regulator of sigma subunit)